MTDNETLCDIIAEKRRRAEAIERVCAEKMKRGEMVSDRYARELVANIRREADRLEAALKRERISPDGEAGAAKRSLEGCDCAKLREALSDACYAMFNFLKTRSGGYEEMANALDKAKAALAAPPRNCDRFGGDIDKLREACARERGLNPEEDFPDVFPDWLLALAQEGGAK